MGRWATLSALALLARVDPAWGWNFMEHWTLGSEAFRAACTDLKAELASGDEATRQRLELACAAGRGESGASYVLGDFYAQGCALAGDHLLAPDEFDLALTGRNATSLLRFLGQAVENRRHFHPDVVDEWLRYHEKALEIATARSGAEGSLPDASDIRRLELALQQQAFADHFLQDAFAAGHMGFNRAATSNAPARDFHNVWNRKGREVENSNGQRWMTFGDGCLDAGLADRGTSRNQHCGQFTSPGEPRRETDRLLLLTKSRGQVLAATKQSIRNLLHAFATGTRDAAGEQRAWKLMPVRVAAHYPGFISLQKSFHNSSGKKAPDASSFQPGQMVSLREINRPAIVSAAAEVWWIQDSTPADGTVNSGTVFGYTLDYPLHWDLWEGLRTYSIRTYVGVGYCSWNGPEKRMIVDGGYGLRFGSSFSGVLSHELLLGTIVGADSSILHLSYRADVELGKLFLRFQAGPARRRGGGNGYYTALGVGWVLRTRGGGPLRRPSPSRPETAPPAHPGESTQTGPREADSPSGTANPCLSLTEIQQYGLLAP